MGPEQCMLITSSCLFWVCLKRESYVYVHFCNAATDLGLGLLTYLPIPPPRRPCDTGRTHVQLAARHSYPYAYIASPSPAKCGERYIFPFDMDVHGPK